VADIICCRYSSLSAVCLHCLAARSRQDSWASSAQKIRPLEKILGRKLATPQIIWKSAWKNCCKKFLGQFLQIIVKIRPQLGNFELGRFLGRWLPRPQEILLGHFWVQRPWIRPSGTSAALGPLPPPPLALHCTLVADNYKSCPSSSLQKIFKSWQTIERICMW
jgi:hypothetical protein